VSSLILYAKDVYKFFGKIKALDGLNLKFDGGVLGFIGPNGAGKTTTLNLIAGFIKPDGGSIEVFGMNPWDERHNLFRRMALLPDELEFPSYLTGYDVLRGEARLYGLDNIDDVVRDVAHRVNIEWALNQRIGTYSMGMYKRLLIVRTFLNPDVEFVVLDEPFSNIDVESIILITKFIMEEVERGVNFLIASHVLPHLLSICDHFSFIHRGKIIADGDVNRLAGFVDEFKYLIRFRGDPPDNLDIISTSKYIIEYSVDRLGLHITTRDPSNALKDIFRFLIGDGSNVIEVSLYPDLLTQIFINLGMEYEG